MLKYIISRVIILWKLGVRISSTFSVLRPTDFSSTFCANFTSTKTVLRPVLLDQYEIQIWQKVEVQSSKYTSRSKADEV